VFEDCSSRKRPREDVKCRVYLAPVFEERSTEGFRIVLKTIISLY